MECLLAVFYVGSSTVTGGSVIAKQDTWVCLIIGTLLSFLLYWLYSAVIELYPGRNYYDNIIKACGTVPGKILVSVLSLYALFTGALVLRDDAEFIHIENLTETPLIALYVSFLGVALYVLRHRIYVVARLAKFLLPVIFGCIAITVVFSMKDWNLSHIKPYLGTGFSSIAGGSLLVLSLPFGESVVCASLFGQLDSRARPFPVFAKGAALGALVLLAANLRNTLTLGYSSGLYSFSSYAAVSMVALGEFFTRIEVLIGIVLLLTGFFKVCVFLFGCASGVAKVLGLKDYEPISAACALFFLAATMFCVADSQELMKAVPLVPVYSLPIQVLVPLAALIAGKLRNRRKPKKQTRKVPRTAPESPSL
jgi:spore germination protein KB